MHERCQRSKDRGPLGSHSANGEQRPATGAPFLIPLRRHARVSRTISTRHDRLQGGLEPACAKACPTDSIIFGPKHELQERATDRVRELHAQDVHEAQIYGADPESQPGTEGLNAFFILLDRPEAYNVPPDPVVPTKDIGDSWRAMGAAASALALLCVGAALSSR